MKRLGVERDAGGELGQRDAGALAGLGGDLPLPKPDRVLVEAHPHPAFPRRARVDDGDVGARRAAGGAEHEAGLGEAQAVAQQQRQRVRPSG